MADTVMNGSAHSNGVSNGVQNGHSEMQELKTQGKEVKNGLQPTVSYKKEWQTVTNAQMKGMTTEQVLDYYSTWVKSYDEVSAILTSNPKQMEFYLVFHMKHVYHLQQKLVSYFRWS